jgi:hypothetical protein
MSSEDKVVLNEATPEPRTNLLDKIIEWRLGTITSSNKWRKSTATQNLTYPTSKL